jgi:hypothetical protein
MFLLYHSEGCNICEMVLHECYVNDLRTTTCSGMLGHHKSRLKITIANSSARREQCQFLERLENISVTINTFE